MLQTFDVNAGGRVINAHGAWFQYRAVIVAGGGSQQIRVRADGQDLGVYLPGDAVELPAPAALWEVTPADPAAVVQVRVGLAKATTARTVGDVSIIDAIGTNCQTTGLTDNAIGDGATAFVTPAQNTRGIIVRASIVTSTAGAGGAINTRLLAAAVQPTNATPGPNAIMLNSAYANTNQTLTSALFETSRLVPAGWGLYFVRGHAAVAVLSNITLSFEIL